MSFKTQRLGPLCLWHRFFCYVIDNLCQNVFISANCFNSQLLQAAGWCWNILCENFPQKNLSGFLSPPDAITFLCGEFSKHIWTQRQENTIGSYKQILIKTHKYRNCLVSSLSPQSVHQMFFIHTIGVQVARY